MTTRSHIDSIRLLSDRLLSDEARGRPLALEIEGLARNAMVLEELSRDGVIRRGASDRGMEPLAQAAMGALRLQELREIADAMRDQGIDIIPQKGMAYGLMFESGGPIRSMADIDLLVRPEDYKRSGPVMTSLGYQETFPKEIAHAPGHHERAFVRHGRLVEIHQAFLRGRRITVDYDALWARSHPFEADGVTCRRMDADDTFLYHCFHFAMHEFVLGGLRAVWEMRRLVLEDGPDLSTCVRRAREWGTLRATWCSLRFLEICFPDPAPRTIDGSTGSNRKTLDGQTFDPAHWRKAFEPALPARAMLEHFIVQPTLDKLVRPGHLPRAVQLFRKGLLVDSLRNSAGYLLWYAKAVARTAYSRRLHCLFH